MNKDSVEVKFSCFFEYSSLPTCHRFSYYRKAAPGGHTSGHDTRDHARYKKPLTSEKLTELNGCEGNQEAPGNTKDKRRVRVA